MDATWVCVPTCLVVDWTSRRDAKRPRNPGVVGNHVWHRGSHKVLRSPPPTPLRSGTPLVGGLGLARGLLSLTRRLKAAKGSRKLVSPSPMTHGLTRVQSYDRIGPVVAAVAQLVEHLTENQGVPSSSLGCGIAAKLLALCGRGSVVEHLLAKERVVGSNPIARSVREAAT
jgi:hypothetical protein